MSNESNETINELADLELRAVFVESYNKNVTRRIAYSREVRKSLRNKGIDPMLIMSIISLAIQAWKAWRDGRFSQAPENKIVGEPGYSNAEIMENHACFIERSFEQDCSRQ